MKIRVAFAGELPSDPQIFDKINLLTDQIKHYFCKDTSSADLTMLISPSYTGKTWMEWNQTHHFPVCTYYMPKDTYDTSQSRQAIRMDTPLRNILGEAVCKKADAIIAVWNEDVSDLSGATWELMRMAYDKKVPCIWLSAKSLQTYCLWESYYKAYSPEYLNAVCEPLPKEAPEPVTATDEKTPLLTFWEKRRAKYLKKHNAHMAVYPAKEDYLLNQDFKIEKDAAAGEPIRQTLLEKFQRFDSAAIEYNARFQAMMYQRSILPILTTVFLAVGFYAKTLLGSTTSYIVPDIASTVTTIAALLAGIGFLIHGCLNLYVYRLSKSRQIERWQKDFVTDRYMAELFRILIHVLPYGFELDLRKLCAGDKKMYSAVKHLTDDAEPNVQNLDRKSISYILKHLKEMLDDQLAYHKSSAGRYETIVTSLEKWGQRIFYLGFGMVLIRGVLQFVFTFYPVKISGININDIVSSFLNMLALMLPAWAGYFSTKIQQNNFRYNLNNHRNMIARLQTLQERITYSMEQNEIPMEILNTLVEELADIMLIEDSAEWQRQYMNSAVKPL